MGASNVRNCTMNYIIQFTAATWKLSLSLMLLLLPLALSHLDNPTDILSRSCSPSSIKNGSAWQGNLKGVLSSLVENVNKTGYNISWHGQNGYEVYGLAQCRGDLNASACQLCVSSATQNIAQNCSDSSSSSIHLGGCFLRYDTHKFYSQIDVWDASSVSRCDDTKLINGSTDENARGVDAQIDSLLIRVVENAVSSNVGYSTLSEEGFYTMAQCWRDLTMDQCNQCLNSLYKNLSGCPAGTSEGEALNDNCVIRYDKDKFYGDGVPLLLPASRATDEGKGRPKMLGLSIGGAVLVVMLVAIVVIWKRKFCFSKQRPDINKGKILDWQKRFDIILGTASGLAYLHQESDIRIIHRDIKASNVLLDHHFKPKIADFGLVRYFDEDQTHLSTGIVGTRGYMAPEYLVHGHLTEKVDVYAFGVLVLEIISGRRNKAPTHANDTPSILTMAWKCHLSNNFSGLIDPNIQGNYQEVLQVVHISLLCTQASATLRPSMSEVIIFLTNKEPNILEVSQPPFIDAIHLEPNINTSIATIHSKSNNDVTHNHLPSNTTINISPTLETYTPTSNISSSSTTSMSFGTISTSPFGPR